MLRKPEQYLGHSSHYLALNAVAQFIQTTAGMWDTCSTSQKVAMLETMARATEAVTEVLAADLARSKQTNEENS